jgi:hypothetical protein
MRFANLKKVEYNTNIHEYQTVGLDSQDLAIITSALNHYGYSLNEAFKEDSQKSDLSQAKCYCYYHSYSYCYYSITIITTHGIILPVAALKQGRKAIQFLPLSSDGAIPSDDVIFPSGAALGAIDFAAGGCIDSD